MRRRAVIAAGSSVLASAGLAGCYGGGLGNNTPSELRLEAEKVSMAEICEQTIQTIDELEFREQEPTREAVESGESVTETSARSSIYVRYGGEFYRIDVSDRRSDHKEMFSLTAERDTHDSMCELVRTDLVAPVDETTVDEGVYHAVDIAVQTGSYESSPLNESATEALNFFAGLDGGRGTHPLYIEFEGEYYVINMNYTSGE